MARLGARTSLHAFHMKVPIKFRIEAVIEGKIDDKGWVAGVSAIDFKRDLEALARELEYKGVAGELAKAGIKFVGMESLARFFLKELNKRYPISYVQVWEGEDEFARVYVDEV